MRNKFRVMAFIGHNVIPNLIGNRNAMRFKIPAYVGMTTALLAFFLTVISSAAEKSLFLTAYKPQDKCNLDLAFPPNMTKAEHLR